MLLSGKSNTPLDRGVPGCGATGFVALRQKLSRAPGGWGSFETEEGGPSARGASPKSPGYVTRKPPRGRIFTTRARERGAGKVGKAEGLQEDRARPCELPD